MNMMATLSLIVFGGGCCAALAGLACDLMDLSFGLRREGLLGYFHHVSLSFILGPIDTWLACWTTVL
jgi:hypothetical protein